MSCSGHVGVDAVINVGHIYEVSKGVERVLEMTYRAVDGGKRGRRAGPFEVFGSPIYPAEADTQISDPTVRRIDRTVSPMRRDSQTSPS